MDIQGDLPVAPRIRVAALVRRADGLLLVKHAKEGRSYWMLPGGGVDAGESLHEALVRELEEELRVTIHPGELAFVNDSIPPDVHRHIVNLYFYAEIAKGEPRIGEDPRVVEAAFLPIADLADIPLYPRIGQILQGLLLEERPIPRYLGSLWND